MLSNSNSHPNSSKPILHSFLAAAALVTSSLAHPLSLWDVLDDYGFKKVEQKQAIEFLLQKSGIVNTDKLLKAKEKSPEELFANIIKFVELTQKHFTIRTGLQERWEVEATEWMKSTSDQPEILTALNKLGITNAVMPTSMDRDVICILGARNSAMRLRLDYAGTLYDAHKLSAKKLVLLAGERYITFDKEGVSIDGTEKELNDLAKKLDKKVLELTETDLMYSSYEKCSLFKKLPTVVIDTPKRELPRPTTETTVLELIQWLKKNPEVKTLTFVSNQPHVKYQEAVIRMVFKREGMDTELEVIGPEFSLSQIADPSMNIKDLVGALGTQIYAVTPSVVEKLGLDVHDEKLKEQFTKLYEKQSLIYRSVKSLFKMN